LSISRRKAGTAVTCPACGETIRVPDESAERPGPDGSSPAGAAAQAVAATREEADRLEDARMAVVDVEEMEEGFRLRRRRHTEEPLDLTPMVDVTFLLLIFFMITASFSLQKSMKTEAPEDEREGFAQMPRIEDLADESVIVEIDENDALFVDGARVIGVGDLQEALMRKMSEERKREMIIEAHFQATHGTVVSVTDAGIEVGMQRIRRVSRNEP
jgi:biopolymer transport protein ExbD